MRKISELGRLADEMEQTWKLQNIQEVPVVISTTVLVPKDLHKALKTVDLSRTVHGDEKGCDLINMCYSLKRPAR